MAYASVVSPIEIFAADEVGRRRHWSDEEKIRIVEESLRGFRQGSATARRYGISRSLLSIWRREYRSGTLGASGAGGGFVPLVIGVPSDPPVEMGWLPPSVDLDLDWTHSLRHASGAVLGR